MFAASTLGKTRDRSAIPHLAAVLKHSDINVCQAAIESLGELRAVSMLDTLGELLRGDTWLRFAVVHTLGEIGDPQQRPHADRPARTTNSCVTAPSPRWERSAALDVIGGAGRAAGRRATRPPTFTLYLRGAGQRAGAARPIRRCC